MNKVFPSAIMPAETPAPIFEIEDGLLEEFQQDTRNANVGTDRGRDAVQNSLVENKFAGAIIVDRNGNIIGGNKTQQAALKSGFKGVKIIKTDGVQAIAIQRTDLDLDSPEGRKLAIALNRTAELGLQWDPAILSELTSEGVDLSSFFTEVELQKLCDSLGEGMEDDGDLGLDMEDDSTGGGIRQFNLFIPEELYEKFLEDVEAIVESEGYESASDAIMDLVARKRGQK